MSRERFEWLKQIGAEVIATPGCESNVKEIYDKCWEIRRTRPECIIFNQFEEFGNPVWHYHVTGSMIEDILRGLPAGHRLAGYVSATGSAGTIAAGDRLRVQHPRVRVVATEALQCPTLYQLGFGGHRIEGHRRQARSVGTQRAQHRRRRRDRRRAMHVAVAIVQRTGRAGVPGRSLPDDLVGQLPHARHLRICNLVAAIKTAKHFDMDGST